MSAETRVALLRAVLLFVPLVLATGAAVWRRPSRRAWAGLLVASAWCLVSVLAINLAAQAGGIWSFAAEGGTHRGVPVDVLLGWTALWGVAFPLAFERWPVIASLAAALWLDLLAMPRAGPLIALHGGWLWGEGAALLFAFLPAQLAYRWTRDDRHLAARVGIQVVAFGGLAFWLLGDIAMVVGRRDAAAGVGIAWLRPFGWLLAPAHGWLVPFVVLSAACALSAVQEFVTRGRGTPIPWDPPRALVVSGLYRYVANPMQLGMCVALPLWGLAYGSPWLVAGASVLIAFSGGVARWHESVEFVPRHGEAGARYRSAVRWGVPRLRPYVTERAVLYYGAGCDPCEGVARWLGGRHPVGLDLVPAQRHPERDLSRLTYRHPDGDEEEGVAALARGLEHLHAGWALVGAVMRLPVIRPSLQLLIDVSGGGPRLIPRRS